MILINFNRPFKPDQIKQIEALTHEKIERVIDFATAPLDGDQPVLPQLGKLLKSVSALKVELRSEPVIVHLPTQTYLAALLMADLHGWMGYFPRVIRTSLRMGGGLLPVQDVAEVLDLQAVEDQVLLSGG